MAPKQKTYVHVEKFGISKIFDDAYKAKARAFLQKEARRLIDKSSALTTRGDAKQEGLYVDGNVTKLLMGESGGKTLLAAEIKVQMATWPKRSMFGFVSGAAKVEVLDETKVERDVEDLLGALLEDLFLKKGVNKELEKRAG